MTISANIKNVFIRETADHDYIKNSKLLKNSFQSTNLLISLILIVMASSGTAQAQDYSSTTNSNLGTSADNSHYSQGTISVVEFNFNNTGIERGSLRAFPDAESRFGEFANSLNQGDTLHVSSTASHGGPRRNKKFEATPISELQLDQIKPFAQATASLKSQSNPSPMLIAGATRKTDDDPSS